MLMRVVARAVRAHLVLVIAVVAVTVGTAIFLTSKTPAAYGSSSQILVSASRVSDPQSAYQGELFAQQRVQTYAVLARGEYLADRVIARFELDLSPGDLASRVTPSVPTSTTLINLAVTGASPSEARQLSQDVTSEFMRMVEDYETGPNGRVAVRLEVTRTPQISSAPLSPRPLLNAGVALVIGLALGVGAAVSKHRRTSESAPRRPQAAAAVTTGEARTPPTGTAEPRDVRGVR